MPYTIDVDSHVYEQQEIWSRYIDLEDRALAKHGV